MAEAMMVKARQLAMASKNEKDAKSTTLSAEELKNHPTTRAREVFFSTTSLFPIRVNVVSQDRTIRIVDTLLWDIQMGDGTDLNTAHSLARHILSDLECSSMNRTTRNFTGRVDLWSDTVLKLIQNQIQEQLDDARSKFTLEKAEHYLFEQRNKRRKIQHEALLVEEEKEDQRRKEKERKEAEEKKLREAEEMKLREAEEKKLKEAEEKKLKEAEEKKLKEAEEKKQKEAEAKKQKEEEEMKKQNKPKDESSDKMDIDEENEETKEIKGDENTTNSNASTNQEKVAKGGVGSDVLDAKEGMKNDTSENVQKEAGTTNKSVSSPNESTKKQTVDSGSSSNKDASGDTKKSAEDKDDAGLKEKTETKESLDGAIKKEKSDTKESPDGTLKNEKSDTKESLDDAVKKVKNGEDSDSTNDGSKKDEPNGEPPTSKAAEGSSSSSDPAPTREETPKSEAKAATQDTQSTDAKPNSESKPQSADAKTNSESKPQSTDAKPDSESKPQSADAKTNSESKPQSTDAKTDSESKPQSTSKPEASKSGKADGKSKKKQTIPIYLRMSVHGVRIYDDFEFDPALANLYSPMDMAMDLSRDLNLSSEATLSICIEILEQIISYDPSQKLSLNQVIPLHGWSGDAERLYNQIVVRHKEQREERKKLQEEHDKQQAKYSEKASEESTSKDGQEQKQAVQAKPNLELPRHKAMILVPPLSYKDISPLNTTAAWELDPKVHVTNVAHLVGHQRPR